MTQTVEQWGLFELALEGTAEGNPFVEVAFSAKFRYQNRVVEVPGFYDGEGIYRLRFMPDARGEWSYITYSNIPQLDGKIGSFICGDPAADNHGFVRIHERYHFAYADGTPYRPIGTTCYAWTHQSDALESQTLESLKNAPFNKIRMCVFPKRYTFNTNEPPLYPFERTASGEWDFARFNPSFFRHFEGRVNNLLKLGIEADVILLHPYDSWGFAHMDDAADERYLRYVVARLAAYRNVWWSLANEYDIMPKPLHVWDRFFQIVQESDPYQHLRSVHNWVSLDTHSTETFYDFGKPWVTHCSIQHAHVDLVDKWRDQYRKPVVVDECCYEGDLPNGWGNITAQEMVRRFWEGTARGGYVTHGETYLDPNDVIWWAKGGVLKGESVARIAFLRDFLATAPPLNPTGRISNTHMGSAGVVGEYYLMYFGARQPGMMTFTLPEGRYQADIIDTWEMTITPVETLIENGALLSLPRKPFVGVRMRRV